MTSRQRVLSAIRHEETDRVPLDIGSMRSTGISAMPYARLREHLGLGGKVRLHDLVQQLAQIDDDILDHFGADVVDLGRAFLTEDSDWHEWVLPDGTSALAPTYFKPEPADDGGWVVRDDDGDIVARMAEGAFYFDQSIHPLADVDPSQYASMIPECMNKVSWAYIPSPPAHLPFTDEGLAEMAERAKWLHENTDRAILVHFGGSLVEWGQMLRGFDKFLMDMVLDPEGLESLLDKLVELHLENLEKMLNAIGKYVQVIQFGDDMGTNNGPQFSPDIYRKFFKPRHAKIYGMARDFGGPHVFLHCCGGVRPIIGDLIDAGVEILNPVQTSAQGMDPAELKQEFGKDITFWGGGCDTAAVLPRGTVDQVKAHVTERLKILSPGGGFIFNQVHNITPDVPPENILAMYEAYAEFNGL